MTSVLVTGGGGFVGTALVRQLRESGRQVLVVGRNRYRHIEEMGAHCLVGDIADGRFLHQAFDGVETVFHTAAKAGIWGPRAEYRKSNILGTEHVIRAAREKGVRSIVYTSTPSVVFDQADITGGDERLPYPKRFLCTYSESKVIAEKLVLAANSPELATCAIRPHLIWGPGDPHLVPRLIERGRAGALKIVGSGDNLVDITYIDNVAHAHVLAAHNLSQRGVAVGQAYFIGQERPVKLWQWINSLYHELGIPQITDRVPFVLAYCIGAALEMYYRIGSIRGEPRMTRFLALQLARSHYFSHDKARREIGYRPVVSLEQGMKQLVEWLQSK